MRVFSETAYNDRDLLMLQIRRDRAVLDDGVFPCADLEPFIRERLAANVEAMKRLYPIGG